jgi:hypothetical protein
MEVAMKLIFAMVLLLSMACDASASAFQKGKVRIANNADTCLADCASQNASCKRVCPTTFNTPCLSSCDSQMQICSQACRAK